MPPALPSYRSRAARRPWPWLLPLAACTAIESLAAAPLEGGPVSERAVASDAGVEPEAGDAASAPALDSSLASGGPDAGILLTPREAALLSIERDAGAARVGPPPGPTEPIVLVRDLPPRQPAAQAETTRVLLGTVVGLVGVVALAYLATRRRVRELERRLGMWRRITRGLGFVLIGVAAREAQVFTDHVLRELTPVMQFGLGWLGFLVGYRFDVRLLDRLPVGTARAIGLSTTIPLVSVSLACAITAFMLGSHAARDLAISSLALGLAGAISTETSTSSGIVARPPRDLAAGVHHLDEIVSVIGLALLSCYLRPQQVALAWELPGTVWVFIALGLGLAVGMVIYGVLGIEATDAEFLAVTLGSVAFASGMAGYLHLSPMVACFVAGALVTNLPFSNKQRLAKTLRKLGPPIQLAFLALAGALWDFRDHRGWLLLPAFLAARVAGKWLSARVIARDRALAGEPMAEEQLVLAPMSALSIAVVISIQSLYGSEALGWPATAVIAGAVLMDLSSGWHATARRASQTAPEEG